jgi:hypothetical protein
MKITLFSEGVALKYGVMIIMKKNERYDILVQETRDSLTE